VNTTDAPALVPLSKSACTEATTVSPSMATSVPNSLPEDESLEDSLMEADPATKA
jgi:hypothetical protein